MKRIIYILTILMAASCAGIKDPDPYSGSLHQLSVTASYPEGYEGYDMEGADALVEEINTGSRYSALTDASGSFTITLHDGIYRVNVSGR